MFRNYTLQPATVHDKPIRFDWNPATGEVRGESAALVIDLAQQALKTGELVGDPYPTAYSITDPLHLPSELAVILGAYWILPPDLAAAYPKIEDDDLITEIDADGVEHPSEFRPLY